MRKGKKKRSVCVAPGEGGRPINLLMDKDWEVKAFPHLFPDGKNGLHSDRPCKTKLSAQKYFQQRILNKNPKFASSPDYMYSAMAYLEHQQLNRNMSISFTRGKKKTLGNGAVSMELEDVFSVLEKIKNSPKYHHQHIKRC